MQEQTYKFAVILAPDDDPDSYAPGYPCVYASGLTEEEARERAAIELEPGQLVGERMEVE